MPDPENLHSPAPNAEPRGIFTAEELWSEIGAPPSLSDAEQGTPIEVIEDVRKRVLRGWEDQALSEAKAAESLAPLSSEAETKTIALSASTTNPNVVEGTVPAGYLPLLFDRVVDDSDGTPLSPDDDIHVTADVATTTKYRYQLTGRTLEVIPTTISSVSAYLLPTDATIEHLLGQRVPEVNNEMLQAAKETLAARTEVHQGIKSESRRETPST